jgi:transposase
VSVEALREWRKQAEIDTGELEGLTTEERAELARLRRENRVLRMERDLLKKVTLPRWGSTADGNGRRCDTAPWVAGAA